MAKDRPKKQAEVTAASLRAVAKDARRQAAMHVSEQRAESMSQEYKIARRTVDRALAVRAAIGLMARCLDREAARVRRKP